MSQESAVYPRSVANPGLSQTQAPQGEEAEGGRVVHSHPQLLSPCARGAAVLEAEGSRQGGGVSPRGQAGTGRAGGGGPPWGAPGGGTGGPSVPRSQRRVSRTPGLFTIEYPARRGESEAPRLRQKSGSHLEKAPKPSFHVVELLSRSQSARPDAFVEEPGREEAEPAPASPGHKKRTKVQAKASATSRWAAPLLAGSGGRWPRTGSRGESPPFRSWGPRAGEDRAALGALRGPSGLGQERSGHCGATSATPGPAQPLPRGCRGTARRGAQA